LFGWGDEAGELGEGEPAFTADVPEEVVAGDLFALEHFVELLDGIGAELLAFAAEVDARFAVGWGHGEVI
jgi:hypothetical protein